MGNQIIEFFTHIGGIVHIGTLVEYYDYIKAVEYLVCVGFLVVFPIFYKNIIMYNPDSENQNK
ncbi:MAG: hypothetical protein DRH07_06255 [Deltaproteobacteria bacterium]|nr:MAG: hypothetical protein DRH07_06255 [Deltaproteobacteria bacterium]